MSWIPIVLGAILGIAIGYALAGGNPVVAPIVAIVCAVAMVVTKYVQRSRAEKEGIVLYDEMHVTVANKAGYAALRVSLIAVALILIVTVWPLYFGVAVVPVEIVEKLYPGLGLSFAIMTMSYLIAYAYYMKSKKVIEG